MGNVGYNIRVFEFRAISGLGRIGGGGGLARDLSSQNLIVHMGLGRASWHPTPGLPPPFRRPLCPSCRVGFAPIPTKSGASRASGLICGSWERCRQGQRRPRAGHSRRLWERLWERRRELGANTYRVLVLPTSTERALIWFGTRADPRERGPPCAGAHGRLAEAGACRSS